jgi:lipopolysaccharide export system permease protein
MTILTRYLIRSHLGPFLFTFSLLTGLLFLNAIAQRLDDLAGKGLPRDIILESLLLSLPHTIAITLPMAVLPAVLYTFSELAANSEIIAMSGGGVSPRRLFLPALLLGVVLSVITFLFNDRVLPEANHRLKNLQVSIQRKSPTFQLRERVVNVIEGENGLGPYYLRADFIDPASNELTGVVIYDMSRQGVRRSTYAARGEMKLNASFTDLQLRLHDGETYEVDVSDQRTFQRTAFEQQLYVLRGVGDIFEDTEAGYRSDREMTVAALHDSANAKMAQLDSIREESRLAAVQATQRALGLPSGQDAAMQFSKTPPGVGDAQLPQDDMIRMISIDARTQGTRFRSLGKRASQYRVEIHKKLVIASACMIFVLIGMPVGVRFSRAGISMVIVVSAVVIGVYQYGMSTGEDWADRGLATPFWSMWAASLTFLVIGTLLASRLGRWTASSRESGWRELWLEGRAAVRRVFSRRGSR